MYEKATTRAVHIDMAETILHEITTNMSIPQQIDFLEIIQKGLNEIWKNRIDEIEKEKTYLSGLILF